ncbi:hypothetical protein JOF28_000255 [Leucobacter exalbidus]|uniref:Uncharacterized protein n=1 Tax=Leucobacter exalbidus TaxID=662960 RepID=A0A940T2P6_9MICO|nr:hypothetical protein [Leucobacter exalbidus]MBP1325023.1 hypothetical protein [Leucobacter exalbidus]
MTYVPAVRLTGELHPNPGYPLTVDTVTAHLRSRRLLAAVGQYDLSALARAAGVTEADRSVIIALAATEDERVFVLENGKAQQGLSVAELCAELAAATRANVEISGEYVDANETEIEDTFERGDGADESHSGDRADDDAHGDSGPIVVELPDADDPAPVLIFRGKADLLPMLAKDAESPLETITHGDWTIVGFEDAAADPGRHGWTRSETPVIELSAIGEDRYLTILTSRGALIQGCTLTWQTPTTPVLGDEETFEAITGDHPGLAAVLASLANPHLDPESEMTRLLSDPAFAHIDAHQLATALQLPPDEHWFTRVLTVLELPALAAAVFEAGGFATDGEDSARVTRVEPGGFWASMRAVLQVHDTASPSEIERKGIFGRIYAATVRQPARMLFSIVPELALGSAALAWVATSDHRPWWLIAVGFAGGLAILDAVVDIALMIRRITRQRRGISPRN